MSTTVSNVSSPEASVSSLNHSTTSSSQGSGSGGDGGFSALLAAGLIQPIPPTSSPAPVSSNTSSSPAPANVTQGTAATESTPVASMVSSNTVATPESSLAPAANPTRQINPPDVIPPGLGAAAMKDLAAKLGQMESAGTAFINSKLDQLPASSPLAAEIKQTVASMGAAATSELGTKLAQTEASVNAYVNSKVQGLTAAGIDPSASQITAAISSIGSTAVKDLAAKLSQMESAGTAFITSKLDQLPASSPLAAEIKQTVASMGAAATSELGSKPVAAIAQAITGVPASQLVAEIAAKVENLTTQPTGPSANSASISADLAATQIATTTQIAQATSQQSKQVFDQLIVAKVPQTSSEGSKSQTPNFSVIDLTGLAPMTYSKIGPSIQLPNLTGSGSIDAMISTIGTTLAATVPPLSELPKVTVMTLEPRDLGTIVVTMSASGENMKMVLGVADQRLSAILSSHVTTLGSQISSASGMNVQIGFDSGPRQGQQQQQAPAPQTYAGVSQSQPVPTSAPIPTGQDLLADGANGHRLDRRV